MARLHLPAALLAVFLASTSPATAFTGQSTCVTGPDFAAPIAVAATRFRLPETLVRAVIAIESDGVVTAVSPKGAMGLMQLMPDTWTGLRLRHALGSDPFDPCDNILAGTAYLRELLDRYGDPGFLAAYNAGPGRYESYVSGARPLPAETIAYVARISGGAVLDDRRSAQISAPDPDAWRAAELFARPQNAATATASNDAKIGSRGTPEQRDARSSTPAVASIFVVRTGAPQ